MHFFAHHLNFQGYVHKFYLRPWCVKRNHKKKATKEKDCVPYTLLGVCVCGQQHSSSNITFFSFIHSQFSRSLWPSSPLSLFLSLSFYKKCSISFASRHAKFRRDFIRVKKKKEAPGSGGREVP